MNYYVKYDDCTIDGPFSIKHIRSLIETGTLSSEAGIVEDRYQGLPALRELTEWPSVSQVLDGEDGAQRAPSQMNLKPPPAPVVRRYRDAYRVGAALAGLGNGIKAAGGILAGVIAVGSLSLSNNQVGVFVLIGVFTSIIVGGLFWVCGVVVAAQGQILRATLDNAVASSHFLTDPERAEAMGLPRSVAGRAGT